MINYKETARRWLEQSESDIKIAKKHLKDGEFSYACFLSEQSAQKSLKGYLISKRDIDLAIHSVSALAERAGRFNDMFKNFVENGISLDKYYLGTRYPDALPGPLVPAKSYGKEEAEAAVELAQQIFDLCQELTGYAQGE